MTILIINHINETCSLPTIYCSVLVSPIIYFTTPLQSTLNQDVNQLTAENYKYDPNQGMLYNISKGVEAYEAWTADEAIKSWIKGQEESAFESNLSKEWDPTTYDSYLTKEHQEDLVLDQLWEDMKIQNIKNYEDFVSNKEEYRAGAEAFDRAHNRRLCKSRKARSQAKKASKLSLFNRKYS
jgi:hypothetical protein